MSDYIEIELASGLNYVLYKNPHAGVAVKPDTQLFIKNDFDNEHTPIGTLAEVKSAGIRGKGNCLRKKDGTKIEEIDIMSDKLNIKLFATPPTVGGKRKTRKYKRKNKKKTRKYKKR